jgi:hypothetical protein
METTYTALAGLQHAEVQLNRTASLLARSPYSMTPPQDELTLSDAAISLLQSKNTYETNLNTIKVADEMQKSALSLG